ncbi:MAG: hypothetical protein IJW79_09820 [Clostridia bacterium]|nr:hypothetical protein [Clostridia bacterium]
MKKLCFDLLKTWCDGLLSLRVRGFGDPTIDGAFHCRACKVFHGRCPDAIYPLVYMYKATRDEKYLDAAKAVFDWGENMLCDDGAVFNDSQNEWKGITVFAAVALCEALICGKELLDAETVEKWETRLLGMGEWCFENLTENSKSNINYPVTNVFAMALLGKYFGREDFLARAKELENYAMSMITENGFLMGEGKPRDAVTPLGCRPIDIGYNMEESLPSLVKYAKLIGDEELIEKLSDILLKQLDFMLPDGAWDNSFGSRSNKWTYYGSRTSDGCAPAFVLLADRHPAFMEAARRNIELTKACTYDGLLYGGPHYRRHGEHACTHHTFEHANALACVLEHLDKECERTDIPCDTAHGIKHYPEINTYKMACGDYRATVTGYDFGIEFGHHACGGSLTLLWKYGVGPMIAGGVVGYRISEPHNYQLTTATRTHRCLVPRLEVQKYGVQYNSAFFATPKMSNNGSSIKVIGGLADQKSQRFDNDTDRFFTYSLSENGIEVSVENAQETEFILPLIAGELDVVCGEIKASEEIFFLTGGFIATEHVISPDANGNIKLIIK